MTRACVIAVYGPSMAHTNTCRVVAPESLTGNLGALVCTRQTTRDGRHAGEHKAHRTVLGVGRITVTWKQAHHAGRQKVYARPEVDLPRKTTPQLDALLDQTRCACPDWKFGHGHISPCPLVGR